MHRLKLLPFLPALLSLSLLPACKGDDDGGDDEVGETGTETGTGTETSETETAETETAESTDTGIEEPDPVVDWPTLPCDPLVPDYCMYPFPNNVFTAADAETVTGRRLAFVTDSLPIHKNGNKTEAGPFNELDGFSPGQAMLTYLPNASTTGLPTWLDIEASLAADSPTVIINAETGERVPHFSEVDVSLPNETDGTFMIRPVVRLADNTRYIVAIRNVQNKDGALIEPSEGFRALRDLQPSSDPDIEGRRPLYADIFQRLDQAGVERGSLQIAWDFTTASMENNTAAMLHMRDDALAMYPEGTGPSITINTVDTDYETDTIAYRIQGTIEVPLYLDQPGAGARLVHGADGLPEMQGTAEYPFIVLIPQSALQNPAPLLQYGHGLLGGHDEVQASHLRTFLNEYNYIAFAVDWIGMADEDAITIATMLVNGTMHDFEGVTDRLHQGLLNFLLSARMMQTTFAEDETFGSYVDPSNVYYLGISQGGIFGGTYMALTQDIERGCVGVPGQPYNLLLNRSVDFDQYFALLVPGYDDSRDLQILLALLQSLWDQTEPTGYSYKVSQDMFPDTPEHQLLIRAAVGDHQVTTLGAHIMARAVGATHLDTGIRDVWDLDVASGSNEGSTYVEYSFGLPMDPIGNVPQEACEDPHGKLRKLEEARMQLDHFFKTGVVENFCMNGVCDFPDMSGC